MLVIIMSSQSRPKIIAGIPAYNEEKYIAKVILKAQKYVNEIIVVDDGSTDMTSQIAEALGAIVIKHRKNLGYGAALKTIFEEARKRNPDVLVILDADDQHNPDDIPKLIKPILKGKADLVIGSRFLGKTNQPLWRRVGVKIITWLTKKTYNLCNITDAQSGFRAYGEKALKLISPKDRGMGASIDILHQAQIYKLKVREVPIEIKHHKDSSTYHPIRHVTGIIVRILQLLLRNTHYYIWDYQE